MFGDHLIIDTSVTGAWVFICLLKFWPSTDFNSDISCAATFFLCFFILSWLLLQNDYNLHLAIEMIKLLKGGQILSSIYKLTLSIDIYFGTIKRNNYTNDLFWKVLPFTTEFLKLNLQAGSYCHFKNQLYSFQQMDFL